MSVSYRSSLIRLLASGQRHAVLAALVGFMLGWPAAAQETPPAPAETRPTPTETPSNAEEDASNAPSSPRRPIGDEDVFIPSEEIAADEEVTFPVDI